MADTSPLPQPWLHSVSVDSVLILFPALFTVGAMLWFRESVDQSTNVPLWIWVSFVLCVDVAHVYSTLFRTYFDLKEFQERKLLYTLVPMGCWMVGVLLYSMGALVFWRVMAYIAVFHFTRQQYGFMKLYGRGDAEEFSKYRWIDQGLIYLATGYPIIFWHTQLPRNFHWFVDGDFVAGLPFWVATTTFSIYLAFAAAYLLKEYVCFQRTRFLNFPKNLIILGTAASWYTGIVLLNGDIAFTITNVVAHGVPYMGLIWIFGRKQRLKIPGKPVSLGSRFFSIPMIPLFLLLLLGFAFMEEGLWDGFVWNERREIFQIFSSLPKVADPATLAWLVPLLSLPQFTHYVLDGFIWKLREKKSHWQSVIFPSKGTAG